MFRKQLGDQCCCELPAPVGLRISEEEGAADGEHGPGSFEGDGEAGGDGPRGREEKAGTNLNAGALPEQRAAAGGVAQLVGALFHFGHASMSHAYDLAKMTEDMLRILRARHEQGNLYNSAGAAG